MPKVEPASTKNGEIGTPSAGRSAIDAKNGSGPASCFQAITAR